LNRTFRYAFVTTIPVFFGYLFLGMAAGLVMQKAGFNALWVLFASIFVYAGSGQFLLASLLASGENLVTVALMTLMVNSRHIFYGLSFIEKFRSMGKVYPYMICALTDETYSLQCAIKPEEGVDENRARFWVSALNHSYWLFGTVLGALAGQLIPFDSTGVEFAMTALFVVLFLEKWKEKGARRSAVLGLVSGAVCLAILGPGSFILPSLIATVAVLLLGKKHIEGKEAEA